MADFKVGDKVTVEGTRWTGTWTITKVNPKNLKLEQNGQRLSAYQGFCTIVTGDGPDAPPSNVGGRQPHLSAGSFVRYIGRSGKISTGQLMVVLADKHDKINVTVAGGDGDRYWRLLPSMLEPVVVTLEVAV